MDREQIHAQRARVSKNYIRRIANCIKTEKFSEAADTAKVFSVVLSMFSLQDKKVQESAVKGLERVK